MDLVAAEFDYPLSQFTSQIINSIQAYSDQLRDQAKQIPVSQQTFTAAEMSFTNERMK